jgi:hypothetical protein
LTTYIYQVRISAIVDACFRLIVDSELALSMTRRGSAQVLGSMVSQSSTISLKRAVVAPVSGLGFGVVDF